MSETITIISLIHGDWVVFPWFAEFHDLCWLLALDFHDYLTVFPWNMGFPALASCLRFSWQSEWIYFPATWNFLICLDFLLQIFTTVTVDEVAPGLKTVLNFTIPDPNSGKVGCVFFKYFYREWNLHFL